MYVAPGVLENIRIQDAVRAEGRLDAAYAERLAPMAELRSAPVNQRITKPVNTSLKGQ
jgi:hypothetical protein